MNLMDLTNITGRKWSIAACSATKGEGKKIFKYFINLGVKEGMEWFINAISKKDDN